MSSFKEFIDESLIPDTVFNDLVKAGSKVGFRIKRSDTFFDFLKNTEKILQDVVVDIVKYIASNDSGEKEKLKRKITTDLNHMDKRKIIAFLINLEKISFGYVGIVKNLVLGFIGVEITTYNRLRDNRSYILEQLLKIREVLEKSPDNKDEIEAWEVFFNIIKGASNFVDENITGPTTTQNIERFDRPIGTRPLRRKRRLKNIVL